MALTLDDDTYTCRSIILRSDKITCHPLTVNISRSSGHSHPETAEAASVKQVASRNGGLDDCIFEIVHLDTGKRRLFMAGSPDDCRMWVQSIQLATLGAVNVASGVSLLAVDNARGGSYSLITAQSAASSSVKEGALAQYACDVALFVAIQQATHALTSIADYRTFIRSTTFNQSQQHRRRLGGECSGGSAPTTGTATTTRSPMLTIPISFIMVCRNQW